MGLNSHVADMEVKELLIIGILEDSYNALGVFVDPEQPTQVGVLWRDPTGQIEDRVIITTRDTLCLMAETILQKIRSA